MIRKSLATTKAATFSVDLPNANHQDLPLPAGTGFFVSGDGYFVTAAHVVADAKGRPHPQIKNAWLKKESTIAHPGAMCQWPEVVKIDQRLDFALLKLDFTKHTDKDFLKGKTEFPHVRISNRDLDDGEPVYSFGYPLGTGGIVHQTPGGVLGHASYSPRTTSAIVASAIEATQMVQTSHDARVYVLDKALNYGNSGGPIIATESGRAHAFCSRFQPVLIPQSHMKDKQGRPIRIMIPSLYGVVTSLANPTILKHLTEAGVEVATD